MIPPQTTVTLYRFFDENRRLLYVGVSTNLAARLMQHRSQSGWEREVTSATFEHFDTWEDGLRAEARALLKENPVYNARGVLPHRVRKVARKSRFTGLPSLHDLRRSAGLTKRALAERSGLSESAISRIESGERNASPAAAERIALALHCTVADLESRPKPVGRAL